MAPRGRGERGDPASGPTLGGKKARWASGGEGVKGGDGDLSSMVDQLGCRGSELVADEEGSPCIGLETGEVCGRGSESSPATVLQWWPVVGDIQACTGYGKWGVETVGHGSQERKSAREGFG
jgi:hypothetical protein